MESYKWKRCQWCGAEAETKEREVKYGHEVLISCPACDGPWQARARWDGDQNTTRARKRFELVKVGLTGECSFVGASHVDCEQLMVVADILLRSMYGTEPQGGE